MNFFSKTMKVAKLAQVNDTNKFTYAELSDEYLCSLQPASPEETQLVDGQIGSIFNCFTASDCPADIADKVTIDDQDYKVKGMSKYEFGSLFHKKLVLAKAD